MPSSSASPASRARCRLRRRQAQPPRRCPTRRTARHHRRAVIRELRSNDVRRVRAALTEPLPAELGARHDRAGRPAPTTSRGAADALRVIAPRCTGIAGRRVARSRARDKLRRRLPGVLRPDSPGSRRGACGARSPIRASRSGIAAASCCRARGGPRSPITPRACSSGPPGAGHRLATSGRRAKSRR